MTRAARRRQVRRIRRQAYLANQAPGMELLYAEIGPPPRWAGAPFYEEKLATLRSFYGLHRDEILARYGPDERPWCWWKWDVDAPARWRATPPRLGDPDAAAWLRQHEET